jgi:hypothetical protein
VKRRDVFTQILHEVSGKPKAAMEDMLNGFLSTIPGQHKFDEEISDTEYEQLLNVLRNEKEGIAKWLMDGYQKFVLQHAKPQGNA